MATQRAVAGAGSTQDQSLAGKVYWHLCSGNSRVRLLGSGLAGGGGRRDPFFVGTSSGPRSDSAPAFCPTAGSLAPIAQSESVSNAARIAGKKSRMQKLR